MIILGIETSCDETALCLLETQDGTGDFKYRILGNVIHSQIELHKEYGGVFPLLAKREHIKNLPILFEQIKKESRIKDEDIRAIAVTEGPGLEPALWTGIVFAEDFGKKQNIPVYPVNHMEGHIVSTLVEDSKPHKDFRPLKPLLFPALAVLISGGHTEIVSTSSLGSYKVLGRTRDDAIGEAYDKTARMLGISYPGGPEISRLAQQARDESLPEDITLPRPMIHSKDFDFSFSGLKTSILYMLKEMGEISEDDKKKISREFENAVTEVLISKTKRALGENEYHSVTIGGGVSANLYIQKAFGKLCQTFAIPLYLPAVGLYGDNAMMIALTGAIKIAKDLVKTKSPSGIKARGNLLLESE